MLRRPEREIYRVFLPPIEAIGLGAGDLMPIPSSMATVRRFEDLVTSQKSRRLAAEVFRVTARPSLRRQFALADQMRRAGVSIVSNVAEGFERKRLEVARLIRQ